MARWNGVPFETFQNYKERHNIDDVAAIRALDDRLSARSRFAYYLDEAGAMLAPYEENKLPNSLAHRLFSSMSENGYHDADHLMFFKCELTPLERECEPHSLQEGDVQTPQVQEKLESDNLYIFLKYEECLQKYERQHYARKGDALPTIIRNYLHHLDKDTAIRAQISETTENKKVSRGESAERNLFRDYKNAPAKIDELRKIFPNLPPLPMKK